MKSIFYSLLTILILSSCTENKPASETGTPKSTTIVGTINNAPYPNIIFSDDNNRFEAQLVNGRFSISTSISQPALFTVAYGRDKSTIFINPGDTLFINAEGQRFSRTLSFEGKLSDENAFLTEKALLDRQRYSTKVKDFKLGEAEFIAAMNYAREQNQSEFDKTAKEKKFDSAFSKLINNEIMYEWASDRIVFKQYHEFYNKIENFELSDDYYDFLKELNYDDKNLMGSVKYKSFLVFYADVFAKKELESNKELKLKDNGEALAKFDFIKTTFNESEVIDFLLYITLKQHIQYEGANGTKQLLAVFNDSNQNKNHKTDILKDYSVWENLEEGKTAPTFNYADISEKKYGLENFKGKYVYIDIWATWCGPCRKELPFLEELQETYKKSDKIVFLSISIDQDHDAWRKMVTEKQMKGVQLLADQAWKSSIVRDYKISGIPRFLLIDPEGNILSANAPRPSSERIKTKLEYLIPG